LTRLCELSLHLPLEIFKQQLSQKEKENNKIISKDTTSSEEVTLNLLDILKYSPVKDEQISKIQSILQDIQKKNNDSTAQYKEITKNFEEAQ